MNTLTTGRPAPLPLSGTRRHRVIASPLGELTLVAEREVLAGVYYAHHRGRPGPAALGARDDTILDEAATQFDEYFAGVRTRFDLPVRLDGTPFELAVWELLTGIPAGETRSYGHLARQMGDPALAQEVGAANALNPLCIVVPCHRVIGSDGRLVGYAGGLRRKRILLDHERRVADGMTPLF
jgi:methylated-DNA-[protein]-cysteine S-methyltransferase